MYHKILSPLLLAIHAKVAYENPGLFAYKILFGIFKGHWPSLSLEGLNAELMLPSAVILEPELLSTALTAVVTMLWSLQRSKDIRKSFPKLNYCSLEKPQSHMRFGDEKMFLFRLGVRLLCWRLLCFFQPAWLKLIQDITTPYEPFICQPSFQWKYWRIPPSNLWSPPLLILDSPKVHLQPLVLPSYSTVLTSD